MEVGNDVRTRLQAAALEMFQERGYDRTTAAAIAARAGVTERTFFRYFSDKREVLFDGEERVRTALISAIADAPVGLGPLDTVWRAFRAFQPLLEERRGYAEPRQAIISATPALHERELAKIDALTEALSAALEARNVSRTRAILAAHAGMMAFVQATLAWLSEPSSKLGDGIDLVFGELKAVLAESDE